ncbi:hypothetical protein [Bythopirellula goksoeyrii]|uniref:Nickel uptake substrate-specific transmembrane region n=1 Tax=Bythopirellula goksoeyrii TaxID=1400387 RepID=A0A5B9QMJ0_9BACT|nr:hypothetical protein [Bythopirellula goksoeyrii]QEG35213.1 hypothetical protein Pr1d_25070 [Bythopirellula goksoeyrii]
MRFCACFLSLLLLSGCGDSRPSTFPVVGTVEFADGTPVRFGVIEFIPEKSGPSARGKIDQQGRFVLGTFTNDDGAVAGRHGVVIVQHFSSGAVPPGDHTHESSHTEESSVVDIRFSQLGLSPLSATIEEENNEVNLRVERASSQGVQSGSPRRSQP